MLIGLIADVHSNVVALEAVLLEMEALGVEKILHAGDIVGYNPYPNDPDEYVYPEDVEPGLLKMTSSDILVLGHTHIQFKKQFKEGIIVNPGSVGQPRDQNPASAFAILDTDTKMTELKRTGYDIEKVIEDMRKTYLPEEIDFRLRDGV